MAVNIEMNYYNGSSYVQLRPMGSLSNMEGSLTADQIPNLDMSKITSGNLAGSRISGYVNNANYASNSGKLGGYTYSQVISNAGGGGINYKVGSFTGTGNTTGTNSSPPPITVETGVNGYCFIIFCVNSGFGNSQIDTIQNAFSFKFKDSVASAVPTENSYSNPVAEIVFSGTSVSLNLRIVNADNYYINGFNISGKKYNWVSLY